MCIFLFFLFQELLERAEWGAELPTVENNLQEHNAIHTAVEELMNGLQEARSYEVHKENTLFNVHTHSYLLAVIVCYEPVLSCPSG